MSALNETFDNSSTYFPLNQSIYADATHEVVVLDTLTAFNLTALFNGPVSYTFGLTLTQRVHSLENTHYANAIKPLNPMMNLGQNSFVASKQVPFATHFTTQVLNCPARNVTQQIRFIVNDAVVPVADSHPGCPVDADGLCPLPTMIKVLQARINEIDFNYDCYANYTAKAGVNYNGRAPRNSTS